MPRNIELKARLSPEQYQAARQIAEELATMRLGDQHQIDTYFHCCQGRLKLRQIDGLSAELIAYHRSDSATPRPSDYRRVPVTNPETLKLALREVLGIAAIVVKQRQIYLHHNVRLHLDTVESLGHFLEIEVVLKESQAESQGYEQLATLAQRFDLRPESIVPISYGDMLSTAGGLNPQTESPGSRSSSFQPEP